MVELASSSSLSHDGHRRTPPRMRGSLAKGSLLVELVPGLAAADYDAGGGDVVGDAGGDACRSAIGDDGGVTGGGKGEATGGGDGGVTVVGEDGVGWTKSVSLMLSTWASSGSRKTSMGSPSFEVNDVDCCVVAVDVGCCVVATAQALLLARRVALWLTRVAVNTALIRLAGWIWVVLRGLELAAAAPAAVAVSATAPVDGIDGSCLG